MSRPLPLALRAAVGVALAAVVASGCGAGNLAALAVSGRTTDGRVEVVTTTTVFADLVRQVGGDLVHVSSLVPNGGDVHTFSPRPSDMRRLADAHLIVMNGLGLDDWLGRLIADAGATAPVLRLGEGLPASDYIVDAGTVNPHLWLSARNAGQYATRIGDELARVDPAHARAYRTAAAAYASRLGALDAWIRGRIDSLPPDNRKIVSFHDAFPYFAWAYGLEVVGTVVSSAGQEPGAGQVTRLIDAIRASHVRAVIAEAQFNPALVQAVAAEAGVTVVSDLYDDTLGPAPAHSYEGMMLWDVDRLLEALA